jgi:hypothetical protein
VDERREPSRKQKNSPGPTGPTAGMRAPRSRNIARPLPALLRPQMTPSTSSTASRKPRPSLETSAYGKWAFLSSSTPALTRSLIVDPAQLTTTLRAQLKAYAAYAGSINSALKDVNQIHTELDVEMKPINLVKGRLDRAYDLLGEQTAEEIK